MISYLNPIPTLPNHSGPYKVGSVEFEVPISELDDSSSSPNPQITTVKFRLYYPTDSLEKQSLPWLPTPQSKWTEAYASFLGASSRWSAFISHLPSLINYTTIPVVANAPLSPLESNAKYPLTIFSHGLGGNFNTYSAICGSLASHGIICAAPEHRDGSAPISFVRSADGKTSATIPYQKHSHTPSAEVFNARNAQLRVRLWELGLLHSALDKLNDGRRLTNYAALEIKQDPPSFSNAMDMAPGNVTWTGHSFGAASIVQFVKSVYYHQRVPSLLNSPHEHDPEWRPLYIPGSNNKLLTQITPSSPIALLDLWTMPLRSDATKWLWEKPVPCYAREDADPAASLRTNTVGIMSAEFYNWKDLRNRTRALLSPEPASAIQQLEQTANTSPSVDSEQTTSPALISAELNKVPADAQPEISSVSSSTSTSPAPSLEPSRSTSPASSISSTTSLATGPSPTKSQSGPKLFMIPSSAHLSQSDFGVLFPNLTRYFMKAQDPGETLELNVRAILAVMRGRGLSLAQQQRQPAGDEQADEDDILSGKGNVKRWIAVPLIN